MKYLFIATQLELGGAQVKAVNVAARLRQRGHDAEVWFLYRKRDAFSEFEQSRCLLDRRPTSIAEYLTLIHRLNRLVRKVRPDIIVGFAYYASPLACSFGWLNGVRTRVATQCGQLNAFPRFAWYLDFAAGSSGLYSRNFAASEGVRESFARFPARYRRRMEVVYDGVDLRGSNLEQRQARRLFSLPGDAPLLVNLGRLSREKNQEYVINLLQCLPDVHLAIAGEGGLRQRIRQIIISRGLERRVHLLGEITPERVPDFLRAGDIFVFPSLHEGFGLAAVEAMHLSLPVVSSTVAPLPEVIGTAGIQLPLSDPRAWIDTIAALLVDARRRQEIGVSAKARAACFSLDAITDAYETIGIAGPEAALARPRNHVCAL
jgi:glycosyltransferase involved in cell wall biosynthesis